MAQVTANPAPAVGPARRQRMLAPVVTTGALAVATLALHLRDPHESGSWGICPTAALGFACPGCGGLRAVNDLTNGDLVAAASSNLILVALLPALLVGLVLWFADSWRGTTRALPRGWGRPLLVASAVVLVAFTVVRNLPGSWLAP